MSIAKKYIEGLKKAYFDIGQEEQWNHFEKIVQGAAQENINKLYSKYPQIPESLIHLLQFVDGTYWREYAGEKVSFYFLGSDLEEYPYYFLSSEEMMDAQEMDWLKDYVNREYEDMVQMDEKIIDNADEMNWLHFSDCMNNGGTSQLFVDFSPSKKGVNGQILRYLHDPDEIEVIADSFDEYLQMLIDNGYDFVGEEEEE
ncbi:SMI1/KNR4 family protein [Lachnospiraceae bacterium]|nr:SMI1/KNR4 family protein [Lachnospiraceae bacterium]